ncbi:hypothetical protein BDR26DRAFT_958274 [Obelidium mucronatum]|nr:hypothetical protein BDR26DRAFT_958274 [Obelidium mucronatum]
MSTGQFARLASRGVLRVSGADAGKFLQGLTTNQLQRLAPGGDGQFSAFLVAAGRVLCEAFVHPAPTDDGGFLLDADARALPALAAHLRKYALRAKVAVDDASAAVAVRQAWGAALDRKTVAAVGCADPRHADLGVRFLAQNNESVNLPSSFVETSELEYKIHRILTGIPEGIDDIFPNVSLPLESNFDLMSGVDFRKGCYLGQELTIRTYHIGVTRKRIVPVQIYRESDSPPTKLELDRSFSEILPPSTTEIRILNHSDGSLSKREVGKFGGSVFNIGLALVRLEHAGHGSNSDLVFSDGVTTTPGLRVRAFPPSWIPAAPKSA